MIWWVLLGVLLIGFALTDGFDMGVGALLPFVAKTDIERRVAINTVGPVWEGNQVWFILGGGAIFAAWPPLYAVSFSGFYLAMFVVLAALILRPVGFKYRSKRDSQAWRNGWDWALFIGGAVPALLFGVAVGNVLLGVPFHLTEDLMPMYEGNALRQVRRPAATRSRCSPAWSRCRCSSCTAPPGSSLKGGGVVAIRARAIGTWAGVVAFVGYALAGLWLAFGIDGFALRRGRGQRPVEPALLRGDHAAAAGSTPTPHGPGSPSHRRWASSAWRLRVLGLRAEARGLDAAVVEARRSPASSPRSG